MAYDWSNWYSRAERELTAALATLEAGVYESTAFHAHQAAEQALKALFLQISTELPGHSHSLLQLAELCGAPENIVQLCRRLNPHYIASRYPDAANGDPALNYDEGLAQELLGAAESVVAWVSREIDRRNR